MIQARRLGQPLGSPSNGYGAARSWGGTEPLPPDFLPSPTFPKPVLGTTLSVSSLLRWIVKRPCPQSPFQSVHCESLVDN